MNVFLLGFVDNTQLLVGALAVVCIVLAVLLCFLVVRWITFVKELSQVNRQCDLKRPVMGGKTTVKGACSEEEMAVIVAAINMYYQAGFCLDENCEVIIPQFRVKNIKKIN